jgi:hypothetical protein
MACSRALSKQRCHRFKMGMEAAIFNGFAVTKHRPHFSDA